MSIFSWTKKNPPETKVSPKDAAKAAGAEISQEESRLLAFGRAVEVIIAKLEYFNENNQHIFFYYSKDPQNAENTRIQIDRIHTECGKLLNFNQKVKDGISRIERELKQLRGKGDILTKKEEVALDFCYSIDKEIQKAVMDLDSVDQGLKQTRQKQIEAKDLYNKFYEKKDADTLKQRAVEKDKEANEYLALAAAYVSDAQNQLSKIRKQIGYAIDMEIQILKEAQKAT